MSLKYMSLDELQEGYEKGKVTDEEIEQHLLEQFHQVVKNQIRESIEHRCRLGLVPLLQFVINDVFINQKTIDSLKKVIEHEYQKLKDNG